MGSRAHAPRSVTRCQPALDLGADTHSGAGGDDFISGLGGDDIIYAGAGDDLLSGGTGNDQIDGVSGSADTATFELAPGTAGSYSIVDGTGEYAGAKVVLLTDAGVSETIAIITIAAGVVTVTGVGAGEDWGTDTLSNVDRLVFQTGAPVANEVPAGAASLDIASGVVVDGLVAGATVFMDANGDGVWNEGEATTVTASDGSFSFLSPGSGPIVATGGINTDTGLPNRVTLTAPVGSSVVNPLTTLIQAVMTSAGTELSAEDAAAQVATSLGLSGSIDLLNTDLVAAAAAGDANALDAQKAAAIVVSIIVAAEDASDSDAAGAQVMGGLAALILTPPLGGLSLSSEETIAEVLGAALDDADVEAVAGTVANHAQQMADATDLDELTEVQAAALTSGNDLDNVLIGGSQDDDLYGFGGNDVLTGGAGINLVDGGTGSDTASYATAAAGVAVTLLTQGSGQNSVGAGIDTLVSIENLIGSAHADTLTGNSAANIIVGLAGADTMTGGAGDDVYGVDDAGDTVIENGDEGHDEIRTTLSQFSLADLAHVEHLTGAGSGQLLVGNAAANRIVASGDLNELRGEAGSDTLIGAAGSDTLTGGSDVDTLTGGAGADLFRDTAAGLDGDSITDFAIGDRIVISDAQMDGFSFTVAGSTLSFTGGSLNVGTLPHGRLIASAAAGGGIEIAFATTPPVPTAAARFSSSDFNGDGRDDVLWRSDHGTVGNWLGTPSGGFLVNNSGLVDVGAEWSIVGTGDFNGDGFDDLLWRSDSGAVGTWHGAAGGSYAINDQALVSVGAEWSVVGTGDFNGDGEDDILWRSESGALGNWLGTTGGSFVIRDGAALVSVSDEWHIVGTGDYNGDGFEDLLWRSEAGPLGNWLGNATGGYTINDGGALMEVATEWNVVGTGDFNGDGRDDILWRSHSGAVGKWLGTAGGGYAVNDGAALIQVPLDWNVAGVGDYNGDGFGDILWRSDGGAVGNWLGNAAGGFTINDGSLAQVATEWQIQSQDVFWG